MNAKPTDIVPDLLWYDTSTETAFGRTAFINPDRHENECDTCWGSHGCHRPDGHEGAHWCDCCDCTDHPDPDSGCVAGPPYYGPDTTFFSWRDGPPARSAPSDA